ncbi:MAG: CPBP family intramembrane glutamic endopeptidase [Bacteroidota bacterium]
MNWDYIGEILTWQPQYLPGVLAIAAVTIGFIVYYFIMISPKLEQRMLAKHGEEEGGIRWVIFQRLVGAAALGIPSLLIVPLFLDASPGTYGMSFGTSTEGLIYILVFGAIIIPMNLYRAGKAPNLVQYPQIRAKRWDMNLLLMSSGSWILYLLGYELVFRGFLLYGCVETMGVWPAIAINASIYSFAHFFKGIGETVGAIPFGIIMSIVTLHTGSFLVAFVVHCFLALSNQTVAMFAHPEMEWVKKR